MRKRRRISVIFSLLKSLPSPIAGTSQDEEKNFGKNLKKRGLVLSNNAELLGKPFTETHDAWVTMDEFSFSALILLITIWDI